MTEKLCIGITILLLIGMIAPITSLASTTKRKAHYRAIKACNGKVQGDQVYFKNKRNRMVLGTCLEVNGVLKAIRIK